MRERDREQRKGRETEAESEAGSRAVSTEPHAGLELIELELMSHEIMT